MNQILHTKSYFAFASMAALALAGCSADDPTTPSEPGPDTTADTTARGTPASQVLAEVPASADSQKLLGVASWRLVKEGPSTMTTYAVDANGKVIAQMAFDLHSDHTGQMDSIEMRSVLPESGALLMDKDGKVLGSTLSAHAGDLFGRQAEDVKAYQAAGGELPYDACGWAIFGAVGCCGWAGTGCVVGGAVTVGAACIWGAVACAGCAGGAYAACG